MSGAVVTPAALPPVPSSRLRPVYAVGTGRCGTHFLAQLMALEPGVASHHERSPLADAFHRWCVWNRLTVDPAGFLAAKEQGIRADLAAHALSFEASAYLSLSVPLLHRSFGARFVLMVRRPDRVVSSFLRKGWFEQATVRADPRLPAGYQPEPQLPHHPFSRLAGLGEDGARWGALSRVGKVAYFWRCLNTAVLEDFARVPENAWRVVQLETLGFAAYRALASFIGIESRLARRDFEALAASRPGRRSTGSGVASWTELEAAEFEQEVAPLAERLGYEWRCHRLRLEADGPPAPVPGGANECPGESWPRSWLRRVRRAARRADGSGA